MALTDKDLEHIERLARVRLAGESREKLRDQLARIIEFVRQLQTIDTSTMRVSGRPGTEKLPPRADEVAPCLPRDETLAAAPDRRGGHFAVPPVIEADEL